MLLRFLIVESPGPRFGIIDIPDFAGHKFNFMTCPVLRYAHRCRNKRMDRAINNWINNKSIFRLQIVAFFPKFYGKVFGFANGVLQKVKQVAKSAPLIESNIVVFKGLRKNINNRVFFGKPELVGLDNFQITIVFTAPGSISNL